jgi:cyclophilin family peptidyl-prolyl cis-trans isomerase/HEAT repeat protein
LRILYAFSLVAVAAGTSAVRQDEAVVDVMARVLQSEDRRELDLDLLAEAAEHPEHVVRRRAALAIGRIGDPAGTRILLDLLGDPSSVVRQDAAFALGLMPDPSSFDRLAELVHGSSPEQQDGTHLEAVTAIAKMGGATASGFYDELLVRWVGRVVAGDVPPRTVVQALNEAWRLGDEAPVTLLMQYAESESHAARQASVYSLARLRSPEASSTFLRGIDDRNALIRAWAVRALTASYADSAGLDRTGTARWVTPLIEDPDPRVRINALRTLGTYEDPGFAAMVGNLLSDPDGNVRVQALAALGQLGGPDAANVLSGASARGPYAQRRQALLGLARVARDDALVKCASWITETDWIMRATGAEALGVVGGDTARSWLEELTRDNDARVGGRALGALARLDSTRADALARDFAVHPDPVVRALAVNRIRRRPQRTDVELLVRSYELSLADAINDAQVAVVGALAAVADLGFSERVAVDDQFLSRYPEVDDYLVRRAAQEVFPAAAAQWGPVTPIETGRDLDDYRAIARHLVLPAEVEGILPALVIDTEGGQITVTLNAADAPITVDALLGLADRHFFDGGAWHRVVPNFVIQDGDPRGDGWGGPDFALRDENNRRRYGRGTVGMALSGPDTGGSQFFITHSPQPHLDGTYPVVGEVEAGMEVVDRILQGDRIRTVRRR